MTTPRIRPFEPSDLPQLQRIRAAAFAPVFASFRRIVGADIAAVALMTAEQEQADLLDRICGAPNEHEMYVIEHDGAPVGFCALSMNVATKVGEIGLNAVHPDHQGRGLAALMYAHALTRMRAAGMKVATVGTGADDSHAPARRAYAKAGFDAGIPSIYYYRML
ncbi:MAG: GNAT family N-acetyltransferase [Rhodospirillaceae bacterium]|nr:GNAT family N-acetyltransferase [Rhodospirillaceae bacterium]